MGRTPKRWSSSDAHPQRQSERKLLLCSVALWGACTGACSLIVLRIYIWKPPVVQSQLSPVRLSLAVSLSAVFRRRWKTQGTRNSHAEFGAAACVLCRSDRSVVVPQVGVHGLIITFVDPDSGARRSATFLPEVPACQHVQP